MNTQYKKGALELCILALLSRQDSYGYDVSEALSKRIDLSDGAVYPILRNLKSNGLVTTYLSEDSGGPPRKYYSLTKLGQEAYVTARSEWLDFVESIGELLREESK